MTAGIPLKWLASIVAGQSPASTVVEDFVGDGLPFLQGNAEFGPEHPAPVHRCDSAHKRSSPGDILVSVRAPVGALNVADQSYGIGRGLAAVRPGRRIDGRYCWWWLHSAVAELRAEATGSTYEAVTADDVGGLRVPAKPLDRQRAIADFLDAETTRIDALIAKKRHLAEVVDDRSQAEVAILLVGGASGGALPSGWEWVRARRICPDITVGVVVDPSTYFVEHGIPFVHGTDVRRGWIEESDFKFMSVESNAGLRKSQLQADDVLAMRVGEPGRSAVVSPHLAGSNCASVLIFRRSHMLASVILSAFLNSRVGRSQIEAMQYGAAQGVLNVGHALELKVPVPPLELQSSIAQRLEDIDARTRSLCKVLDRQIALLQERRQALITATVTGEVDLAEAG